MGVKIVEPVPRSDRWKCRLTERARRLVHLPSRLGFRQRLKAWHPPERERLHLSFGWLSEPERASELRIGGAVKLMHLRERFGESRGNFNLLYLVSSVLHLIPHVAELVRFAKQHQIPVVWNQNGVAYPAWCGNSYPWFNETMRALIHQADHVIYQSAFCRLSADRYLGEFRGSSEILFNPVDVGDFMPSHAPQSRKDVRLLAVGTSHAFYRTRSAIDCLHELRQRGVDASLRIVGEQRWPDAVNQVSHHLAQTEMTRFVTLHPAFAPTEAPSIYRWADVLLHPKYKDPCPTVPIEAMASGLPVVGSKSGGMPELVPPSVGRLVAVRDSWTEDLAPPVQAMADAVEEILAQQRIFSEAARKHALLTFPKQKWVDRHARLFETFLGL